MNSPNAPPTSVRNKRTVSRMKRIFAHRRGVNSSMDISSAPRRVYFRPNPSPPSTHGFDSNPHQQFCLNCIQTSKYNRLTFIPKNLFEQFSRVANLYFLLIVSLQIIPSIQTTHPVLAGLPITIIILVTMAKDGIEDWKRHVADNSVNLAPVLVLAGQWSKNINTANLGHQTLPPVFPEPSNADVCHRTSDPSSVHDRITFMNDPKTIDISMPATLKESPEFDIPQGNTETKPCASNGSSICSSGTRIPDISPKPIASDHHQNFSNATSSSTCLSPTTTHNGQSYHPNPPSHLQGVPHEASWHSTTWEKLQVGDIVYLQNNEAVPADIVLITASELYSTCYVETISLDGETNLKLRHGFPEFAHIHSAEQCAQLRFDIECEPPNSSIYALNGTLRVEVEGGDMEALPICINNLLLRGTVLRNTHWAIGAVVYTGKETKIMLNSGDTKCKRSKIDRDMQPEILLNFGLLFALCMTCAVLNSTWKRSMAVLGYTDMELFNKFEYGGSILSTAVFTFFSSLVVFQNIVPISLYISIEFVKTVQAYLIYSDPDLSYNETPCKPRTWNISDDLGLVQYVFSDKTGTLTRNVMEFKLACIGGIIYGGDSVNEFLATQAKCLPNQYATLTPNFSDSDLIRQLVNPPTLEWLMTTKHFLMSLSLCHTVQVSSQPHDGLKYLAQSPDEGALVSAARDVGYTFLSRNQTKLTLSVHGQNMEVQLLHVIEFNSSRKRMSVVVRFDDNSIFVYTKGADSHVFPRLAPNQEEIKHSVHCSLEIFATKGLRTLALAYRELSQVEYTQFSERFASANLVIHDRDEAVYQVADDLEQNLTLLGATAIEDKLQVGVPEAIEHLTAAGVHVWVLTGDKTESAINVGYASKLITPGMTLVLIRGDTENESVENQIADAFKVIESSKDRRKESVLVIDGDALDHVLCSAFKPKFLNLCMQCCHVICSRVSPLQKAQVVAMVKCSLNVLTLAIGDGANDVSMIQEANVGVGIMGEEGRQAVMSSDYAIGQFRFLVKLMLLHGKWSRVRIAGMIHNFFYKNMTWVFVMFWFQFYSGFSAELMHDYSFLIFYNMLFTLLPCVVMGVFDQDLPMTALARYPQLYQTSKNIFSRSMFWIFVIEAAYQSLICFYVPFLTYYDTIVQSNGWNSHKLETSLPMAMTVVMSVNLFVGINLRSVNWISAISILFSAFSLPLYLTFYSLLPGQMNGFAEIIYDEPSLWLCVLLALVLSLLPRIITRFIQDHFWFDDAQIVREIDKLDLPWPVSSHHHNYFALTTSPSDQEELMTPLDETLTNTIEVLNNSPISLKIPPPTHKDHIVGEDELGLEQENPSFMYDAQSRRSIGRTGFAFSQSRGASETVVTANSTIHSMHHRRASLTPSDFSFLSRK